jgi:hypothetical protein
MDSYFCVITVELLNLIKAYSLSFISMFKVKASSLSLIDIYYNNYLLLIVILDYNIFITCSYVIEIFYFRFLVSRNAI